uniref:Integrase catalytic domain-containing protein n=1 Tax=Trichuris muris TaxID=70415 RepID=A0A5S6PZR0_TRIMR
MMNRRKAWIVLFTCAIYRAIHLELVTSLTTEAFVQSLRRFVARRGKPSVVYSDNGTNLVGTREALRKLEWEKVKECSDSQGIRWKLIPPSAAWWGGWWERLIRMLKELLRSTLGRASLNYEELLTVLCDCEAVMNSRPLTYVSDGKAYLEPLTPTMFLQDIRQVGMADFDDVDAQVLSRRAKYRRNIMASLRRRFRTEYLGQLVRRPDREGGHREAGKVKKLSRFLTCPLGAYIHPAG